jgi:hypothetical protein
MNDLQEIKDQVEKLVTLTKEVPYLSGALKRIEEKLETIDDKIDKLFDKVAGIQPAATAEEYVLVARYTNNEDEDDDVDDKVYAGRVVTGRDVWINKDDWEQGHVFASIAAVRTWIDEPGGKPFAKPRTGGPENWQLFAWRIMVRPNGTKYLGQLSNTRVAL